MGYTVKVTLAGGTDVLVSEIYFILLKRTIKMPCGCGSGCNCRTKMSAGGVVGSCPCGPGCKCGSSPAPKMSLAPVKREEKKKIVCQTAGCGCGANCRCAPCRGH